MIKNWLALLCVGLVSASSWGAELYKWVDDNGTVQMGDTVPPKYRNKAKRLNYQESTPATLPRAPVSSPPQFSRPQAPEVAVSPASKAGGAASDTDSYEEKMRKYRASQECFAPYRNATGGIKAEAFQHCTDLPEPQRN